MGAGRPEPAGLFGKAVGLSSPSHASLLQDMRGFAPRIAVGSLSSPPQVLPTFPTQLTVASLSFPAMPSRWPHSSCLLPEGPAGCLERGQSWVVSQGYGGQWILCPFIGSLS